jgi:hypothetical protein
MAEIDKKIALAKYDALSSSLSPLFAGRGLGVRGPYPCNSV